MSVVDVDLSGVVEDVSVFSSADDELLIDTDVAVYDKVSIVDVLDVLKDADVKEEAGIDSKTDEGDDKENNVHVEDSDAGCVYADVEIPLLEDVVVGDDGFVH